MWIDRLRKMKELNQQIDRREWSIEKISQKSGVPKQTLDKIFSGRTQDPKLMTMQSPVYTLGYMLDDLFTEGPLHGPHIFPSNNLEGESFESIISEAYQQASDDDKDAVNAVLRKYIGKKGQKVG